LDGIEDGVKAFISLAPLAEPPATLGGRTEPFIVHWSPSSAGGSNRLANLPPHSHRSRCWARAIADRRRSSHFVHELTLQFGPELFFPACQTLLDLHFLAGDGLLGRDADLRDLVLVLRFHLGNAALVLGLDLRRLHLVSLLHFLDLRLVLGLHLL